MALNPIVSCSFFNLINLVSNSLDEQMVKEDQVGSGRDLMGSNGIQWDPMEWDHMVLNPTIQKQLVKVINSTKNEMRMTFP